MASLQPLSMETGYVPCDNRKFDKVSKAKKV